MVCWCAGVCVLSRAMKFKWGGGGTGGIRSKLWAHIRHLIRFGHPTQGANLLILSSWKAPIQRYHFYEKQWKCHRIISKFFCSPELFCRLHVEESNKEERGVNWVDAKGSKRSGVCNTQNETQTGLDHPWGWLEEVTSSSRPWGAGSSILLPCPPARFENF